MNYIDIIKTASSNMFRSKLRTSLTIIAIFIGALTLSLTNGIGAGVSSYIDAQLGNIGAEDVLDIQQKQDFAGLSDSPQEYNPDDVSAVSPAGFAVKVLGQNDLEKIRNTPGILSAEPLINAFPEYVSGSNGVKYSTTASPFIDGTRLDMASGRSFDKNSKNPEVVLGLAFVQSLGFSDEFDAVGKIIKLGVKSPAGEITDINAMVVGVQQKTLIGSTGVTANDTLEMAMYQVQTAGLPEALTDQYSDVTARFDANISDAELQNIKDDLDAQGYQALTIQDTIGIVKQVISAIIAVLNFFAGIALLAASFGIINTLLMSVQERTKEIGLMKAMGMSGRKIFLLFSTEAILLGFWGSLLGVVVANGAGRIANRIATNSFLKDLPGFKLMSFPAVSMIGIMLIIMLIAFLAGTLPARKAANQNPIDALRYE